MTSLYDDLTAISRRAFAVAEADPFMRPPLGHRHKPYHWVRNIFADMEGKPVVWMWDCDGGVWVADGQHLLPKTENVLYMGPAEYGVGGETFEPTEADITDMAIFLAAAFHDISFSHASEAGFERDTRMRRVAGMVFKHHRYIPSIMAARAEARPLFEGVKDPDLSRDKVITEAKDMIAGLQAEAAGLRTVIARMSENRKLVQCRCGAVLGAADHPPIPGRALRFS